MQTFHRYRNRALDRFAQFQYAFIHDRVIEMDTPEGPIRFRSDPDWWRVPEMVRGGVYEQSLLEALSDTFSEDDVFYNVGARWGIMSLFAIEAGLAPERIHDFEADASNFDLLAENHEENAVHLNRTRVGDQDGPEEITLDAYCEDAEEPTVVKIDVEGAEAAVLRGAEATLREHGPELFVEMHPEFLRDRGDDQRDVVSTLENLDYELTVCPDQRDDSWEWRPLSDCRVPDTGDYLLRARR